MLRVPLVEVHQRKKRIHNRMSQKLRSSWGALRAWETRAQLATWTVCCRHCSCRPTSGWWSTNGNMTLKRIQVRKIASSTSCRSSLPRCSICKRRWNRMLQTVENRKYLNHWWDTQILPSWLGPSSGTIKTRCSSTTSKSFACNCSMLLNNHLSKMAFMGL